MPESQRSGFTWEDNVLEAVFQTRRGGYTDPHDCPKERNRFDPTENVSVKTTGSNTVFLSDALRVFDYCPSDKHTAIVVQYTQTATNKVVRSVYELDLNDKELLFGSVTRQEIVDLIHLIRSVPPGPPNPELRRNIHSMKKQLNDKSGIVQFNPKLDSKTQRRLQCSIPKFPQCPNLVRSHTTEPIVRGVTILHCIDSGRRVRHT
jgi:hypothetical protein